MRFSSTVLTLVISTLLARVVISCIFNTTFEKHCLLLPVLYLSVYSDNANIFVF